MNGRRQFLAAIGATAFAPAILSAASAEPDLKREVRVSHALVLSGGGARGAYEAGLIAGLAARGDIPDGRVLDSYGLVCGTSVGAVNAWFVATGQYTALQRAWQSVGTEHVFELKSKYVTLDRPHSFIGARIRAALRLATGLTKNEMSIAESRPVLDWITRHVDVTVPLLMPMIWAVTNLATESPEYFYRLPPALEGPMSAELLRVLRLTLGRDAIVREASDDIFHRALLASLSIPIVYDPVALEFADGSRGLYVDGGVASNASVTIARTVAENIHIVLLDPRSHANRYANAIDVVLGTYSTMQRRLLELEMRDIYLQSLGIRAVDKLSLGDQATLQADSGAMRVLLHDLPAVKLAYVRPEKPLPAQVADFDQQDRVDATFAIGKARSAYGFTPYAWETFRL